MNKAIQKTAAAIGASVGKSKKSLPPGGFAKQLMDRIAKKGKGC